MSALISPAKNGPNAKIPFNTNVLTECAYPIRNIAAIMLLVARCTVHSDAITQQIVFQT